MQVRHFLCAAFAGALIWTGAGCSSGKPVKLEGRVTLDGKPFEGATVTFNPEGDRGHVAAGRTGNDGTFRLTTFTSGDGALPGDYQVTITKSSFALNLQGFETDTDKLDVEGLKKLRTEAGRQAAAYRGVAKKGEVTAPKVYEDAKTTPLKCRVPPQGQVIFALRKDGA